MRTFNRNSWMYLLHYGLMALIIGMTLVCVTSPASFFLKRSAEFAVHIMLLLLFSGLFFLILNQRVLLLTSLACAGILAYHLKTTSHVGIRLATPGKDQRVSVAAVNLSSLGERYDQTLHLLMEQEIDILAFHEATPDWRDYLEKNLLQDYQEPAKLIRIDLFGHIIFSKYPVVRMDTFTVDGIPSLITEVRVNKGPNVKLLSINLPPPFNRRSYEMIRDYLYYLSEYINQQSIPFICLGDFKSVPWSQEIQEFRFLTHMMDSRRSFNPIVSIQRPEILNRPWDHIFYTTQLECTEFTNLLGADSEYIGIRGTYQFSGKTALVNEIYQEF